MEICERCYYCYGDDEIISYDEVSEKCPDGEDHSTTYVDDEMVSMFIELRERGYKVRTMIAGGFRSIETDKALGAIDTYHDGEKYIPKVSRDIILEIAFDAIVDHDACYKALKLNELEDRFLPTIIDYNIQSIVNIRSKSSGFTNDPYTEFMNLYEARMELAKWIHNLPSLKFDVFVHSAPDTIVGN